MNHTYYRTTKQGKRFVRTLDYEPDVPLTPVYKRAST
jgi:predicted transcriptional regulator